MTASHTALMYWRSAQSSPFGIGLTTTDPAKAKRQLYAARAESGDPTLNSITIRTSPQRPSTDIWLTRDRAAEREADPRIMGARLDRPAVKVNTRIFESDYAFMQRRLAGTNVTPTDLLRSLASAWVRSEEARMLAAAGEATAPAVPSAHE
jgi:hypothetical protein